ncbi:MAG TPA: hypothetical protein VF017_04650 [Thermoanaerobaculia bacterium]|nr:hypothetical protein [Thermoanaerobaculia bacterium]
MRIRLRRLSVVCKRETEVVDFADVSYFYGEIGAGKSSIVHLVDYCLGGTLPETPALQSEFVEAELLLSVAEVPLALTRARGAGGVHAAWLKGEEAFDVLIPAREAAEEVLPGTGVAVLSDLVFYLSGLSAPRVRKSKLKVDSDLVRLSLRDLLWYCYLDQAHMESTFFHLEGSAEFSLRNKSKDVLRFVLGFHQERIAELERELDDLRIRRRATEEGARTLEAALAEANLGSEGEIDARLEAIKAEISVLEQETQALRDRTKSSQGHGVDALRDRARALITEIASTEEAIESVQALVEDEKRHLNELRMLVVKFRRSDTARQALRGVAFKTCPSCTQPLLPQQVGSCPVCGQTEIGADADSGDLAVAEQDADSRARELKESVQRREKQLRRFRRDLLEQRLAKGAMDAELSVALRQYDSVLMSSLLSLEHHKATLVQEGIRLERSRALPAKVSEMLRSVDLLVGEESRVRRELSEAREVAERDAGNLRRLEVLFRDCLVRARFPGIGESHSVIMEASSFYPQVVKPGEENLIVANHANLSSGGKVTIFKCCFAIALHRLATEEGLPLPRLLMIDTPMKNISERNNRLLFESFYDMIYDLAASELATTQLVLVDKEFRPPPEGFSRRMTERYMTLADPEHPPLIRYFREEVP